MIIPYALQLQKIRARCNVTATPVMHCVDKPSIGVLIFDKDDNAARQLQGMSASEQAQVLEAKHAARCKTFARFGDVCSLNMNKYVVYPRQTNN